MPFYFDNIEKYCTIRYINKCENCWYFVEHFIFKRRIISYFKSIVFCSIIMYNVNEVFEMKQNITIKATLFACELLLGAFSIPWWIITYYMITGTLQGEHTAPVCVPIGIFMLIISLLICFFTTKLTFKNFSKWGSRLVFTLLPFLLGILIFLACAFWSVLKWNF